MIIEFQIPELPKIITNGSQGSWRSKWGNAQKWHKLVFLHVANLIPSIPLEKANLTLIRASSQCPDADGLVASFKPVIDGLVKAQVLVDDNMNVIGIPDYSWKLAKRGKGYIIVKIEA